MPVTVEISASPTLGSLNQKTHLILILDTSGSMDAARYIDNVRVSSIHIVRKATMALIEIANREFSGRDVACTIITFSSNPRVLFDKDQLPESADSQTIESNLMSAEGGTEMAKALLLMNSKRRAGANTHCLFLTDGEDSGEIKECYNAFQTPRRNARCNGQCNAQPKETEVSNLLQKLSQDPLFNFHVVGICTDLTNPSVDRKFLKWLSSKAGRSSDLVTDVSATRKVAIMLIGLVKSMVANQLALEIRILPTGPYTKQTGGSIEMHPLALRSDMPVYITVGVKGPCTVSAMVVNTMGGSDLEYGCQDSVMIPSSTGSDANPANPVAVAEYISELLTVFQCKKGELLNEKKWSEIDSHFKKIDKHIAEFKIHTPRLKRIEEELQDEKTKINNAYKNPVVLQLERANADTQASSAGRSFSLDYNCKRMMSDDQARLLQADAADSQTKMDIATVEKSPQVLSQDGAANATATATAGERRSCYTFQSPLASQEEGSVVPSSQPEDAPEVYSFESTLAGAD